MRHLLVVLTLAACAADPAAPNVSRWSLADLGQGALAPTGLSTNLADGHLWILGARGLVETTPDGQYVGTIAYGTAQFDALGFSDVAVLEDGSFALPTGGEGYRYDRVHGDQPFFCLEPGLPGETDMSNQAITLDPATGSMFVAPAYFVAGPSHQLISASLAAYASSDGHFVSSVDITATGVIPQGLAADPDGAVWAVQHDTLYRFDAAGAITAHATLDGVTEAAGLSLVDGRFYVLDAADDEIRIFDRAGI